MKKILYLLLLLPFFASAQAPTSDSTIFTAPPVTNTFTPQFRYSGGNTSNTRVQIFNAATGKRQQLLTEYQFNNYTGTSTQAQITAITGGYVPTSRTLTINGTAFDLSANRTWTVTATPSGSAGGDLTGTYPNPTVNTINSITKSYYDPTSSIQTQLDAREILSNKTATASSSTTTYPNWLGLQNYVTNSALFSRRIIYAKQFGAHLNSNINSGGGTNDAVILQAAIDTLTNRGGGTLVIDGVALISSTIVLKTNVKIQVINGGGLFLAPNSNCHMLTTVLTGQTVSNYNVAIEGGIWNGNTDNQNRWVGADSISATTQWVVGMWLGSMNGYTLKNITMRNAKTFGIILSQSYNGVATNSTFIWDNPATVGRNHDSFHLWGTLDRLVIDGVNSTGGDDDIIPFNTDESMPGTTSGIFEGPQRGTTSAGITNVTVQNVNSHLSGRILRFIGYGTAGAYVDNINLYNFSGDVSFGMNWTNVNSAGRILIEGWYVTGSGTANQVNIAGGCSSLSLSDIAGGTTVVLGAITNKSGDYFSQAALVSGTNIKTVNSSSLLGSGNLAVGDALVANPLSQFAATTSAQLRATLSDETGTGLAYFQGGDAGTPSALVGTFITGIPNAALNNSTISGVTLGGSLFAHSAGYGITGSNYNGSAIQTWTLDTTSATGAVSKTRAAANYATVTGLAGKQATLVSGTNIKTVNSTTLLGSGNLAITPTNTDTTSTGFATRLLINNYLTKALAASTYAPIAGTMYIGTTAHALNRASAPEVLTGITSIDGSAAALTTTRTIWGQNFNGSTNVSGALSGVTTITTSGNASIGTQSGSTATPNKVTMPQDFSSGVTDASLKYYLYDNGSGSRVGMTVGGSFDYQFHTGIGGRYDYYVNNVKVGSIGSTGDASFSGNLSAVVPAYSSGTNLPVVYNSTSNRFETATAASYPVNRANGYTNGAGSAITLTNYTVGASDAPFYVSANILVTTSTVHNFRVYCTYTDESNTSRTVTLNLSQLTGTFITAITNGTGASAYEGVPIHIRAKAGTTITLGTDGTFTSVTYNGGGLIVQEAAN